MGDVYLKKWIEFYKGAFEILYKESEELFNLIFSQSANGGPELATATLLYRKVVETLYGNLSLINNNEFLLIKSFNRELFESMIYLYYVSEGNQNERLISYHVYNFLKNQKKLRMYNPFSEEHKKFAKTLLKTKGLETLNFPSMDPKIIEEKIKEIEDVLLSNPYKPVFEKYYKGKNNRKWYSVDIEASNFEQLVDKLKFGGWYEILYRDYSEYIHSSSLNKKSIIHSINNEGLVSITSAPSPPYDLVADFLYCRTFILTIVHSIFKIFKDLPLEYSSKLKNNINDYFKRNSVEMEVDFFDEEKEKIKKFPTES